jgi:peptidoglycan/xylan/chitin deacetylase (PgdA/CDA1 family)
MTSGPTARIQSSVRTARLSACLIAFAIALSPLWVAAEETLVEDLNGQRKFAPLWPGGTFELGSDAGFTFARVVTDGQGGSTFITNVRPYTPVIDATGKFVKVRIKIDDISKLAGLEFRLSSDRFSKSFFAFGFPVYDDLDFNVLRDGVWTTLTFSFGRARIEGKPDRSRIDSIGWYVADKGNGAPISAWWAGLSLVDEPKEGVVSITFDDGYDENLLAAQIMAKHGMTGTAYIIPNAVGRQNYLTLHELVDMQLRYGWEIAAHHETSFTEMRPDELENTILGVQQFLIENGFGNGAGHLAYPLGRQNTSLVRPLVRKHFTTARVASMGPETLPPADPYLLRAMNVTNDTRPDEVAAAAKLALENHEWLILMFHYLVEKPSQPLEYGIKDFEKAIAGIAKTGIKVMPVARVWEACGRDFTGPVPDTKCQFDALNVAAPKP